MRKVIPIITTLVRAEHNPGDTFIGIGTQYLIERILGPVNWLLINKFGKQDHWNKHKELIAETGFVIYGGTPQYNNYDDWCFWYDKQMWEDIIIPRGLKVISIGGGAGFPDASMTYKQFAERCIKSKKTVNILKKRQEALIGTTVRDGYAQALLERVGIPSVHLPCPATFASRYVNFAPTKNREYVVIVPPAHGSVPDKYFTDSYSNIKEDIPFSEWKEFCVREDWIKIYNAVKKEFGNTKVVCHFYSEYLSLKKHIPPEDLFFTSDFLSLLKVYRKAHHVISARLHGSLPAYGMSGTRVVSVSIDTRGWAVSKFPKIQHLLYNQANVDSILDSMTKAQPSEEEDFEETLSSYDTFLSSIKELKELI